MKRGARQSGGKSRHNPVATPNLAVVATLTHNGVLIMDPDRRIVWVNDAQCSMSGYTRDEMLGRSPRAFLQPPDADPAVIAQLARAVAGGQGFHTELATLRKGGSTYWVDLDLRPLKDEHGVITGWIAVSTDISTQVHLRQRLLAAQERLRVTVDNAELGIYEVDMPTGSVWLGAGWCRLIGLPAEDCESTIAAHKLRVHPEDRQLFERDSSTVELKGETRFIAEYRLRREDGSWLWVRDTGRVIERDPHGVPLRSAGVVTNITGRKQSELDVQTSADRLALAATAADIAVWDKDLVSGQVYWDARMRDIYGLAPNAVVGPDLGVRTCHPEDRARVTEVIRGALASEPAFRTEFRILRADGAVRDVDVRAVIHRNAAGNPTRMIGIQMDVTERNRLLQERQQAQRLESIGLLAAGVAHEINTPIQYIGSNIGFIRDSMADIVRLLDRIREAPAMTPPEIDAACTTAELDYLRAEIPRAIEQSLDGIQRVTAIVRSMKEFSHPATDRAHHDLNRAISSTLTVASNEWKHVADVGTVFDPALPACPVMLGEFNQVILNLVVNAAHAIEAIESTDKGRIEIRTRAVDGMAEISVADTGCGMTPEVRARVFEPFFTTKPVGQGTGQGLAMAHNVIGKHGGTISVRSEAGRGSCFVIRLPLEID